MMIRTAGGPGLVSPIDFAERKKPIPRWMWAAIGVSALVHVGVGVWLYNQRFELADIPVESEGPVTRIDILPMPKPPEPTVAPKAPPAPTPPIHRTENVVASDVKPLVVPIGQKECGQCPYELWCADQMGAEDPSAAVTRDRLDTREWLTLRRMGIGTTGALADLEPRIVQHEIFRHLIGNERERRNREAEAEIARRGEHHDALRAASSRSALASRGVTAG